MKGLKKLLPRRKKILFADNIHLHRRNYGMLYIGCYLKRYHIIVHQSDRKLKQAHGAYHDFKDKFELQYRKLDSLDHHSLYECEWRGIRVFPLIKAELLSYLITLERWYTQDLSNQDKHIFEYALKYNYEDLLYNMAAGIYWLKTWHILIREIHKLKACVMFSGSLIYMKTLNALLQNTHITVYKTEHFLTGNAFYFEENYTSIANQCNAGFENYYRYLLKKYYKTSTAQQEKMYQTAIHLFEHRVNKNVKQPKSDSCGVSLGLTKPVVLIIGQVVNDFSILETPIDNLNTVQWYKKMIREICDKTDYDIIFKAHPWERQKTHLKQALSKQQIDQFIENDLSPAEKKRIITLESYNLYSLIEQSQYLVSLSSQALIEAAFHGRKGIQLGRAFYGQKGFTYDLNSIGELLALLNSSDYQPRLNHKEIALFRQFLSIMLGFELVSSDLNGIRRVFHKLHKR